MTALDKLTDQTFKVIITLVKDRYCPPASEIAQRFTCNTRLQREEVTIAEFVVELCCLSEHCKFADTLDDMLRDRVVCRIMDACLRWRSIIMLATCRLGRSKNQEELSWPYTIWKRTIQTINHPKVLLLQQHTTFGKRLLFQKGDCHKCGKRGHIAKVCHSKSTIHAAKASTREETQKSCCKYTSISFKQQLWGRRRFHSAVLLGLSSTKSAPIH